MLSDPAMNPAQPPTRGAWRDLLERVRVPPLPTHRRILYVDANSELGVQFRRQARGLDVLIDCVTDTIEAFSRCVEFVYDVVVLSTDDGIADKLADAVRTLQSSAAILLLRDHHRLLTAGPCDDPGVAGILTKPWTEKQLTSSLTRALSLADTRRERSCSRSTSLPLTIRVMFVGDAAEHALVSHHLHHTPDGSPIAVHHVQSLAEATAALETLSADAVITSLALPDARGLDAVVHFSEGPKSRPVVALAKHRDEPLVAQLLRHGAHDFLTYLAVKDGRLPESLAHALDRHRATERVAHLAHHDPLTGLPNRVLFEQRLAASLSRASRKHEQLAVLYIDLDQFKPINDRYGHEAGDRVLRAAAQRLQASVRDYDTPARLGGDEFAIVLNSLEHPREAQTVAHRVRAALEQPIDIGGPTVVIGSSIGIAVFPEAGATPEALLNAADRAMYRVKRNSSSGPGPSSTHLRLVRNARNSQRRRTNPS